MSRIVIYDQTCKGCLLCVNSCRFGVLERSDIRGKQGYLLPRVAHPEACRACHICETVCPDLAIEIMEDETDEK